MASFTDNFGQSLAQFRNLSLSQRLTIGLGALLVAVSLLWIGQWAAAPEMVPLLPQDLAADELKRIQTALEMRGQKSRVAGSQIFVPASANRASLLAQLQVADQMPGDTSLGFAALVKESNPFLPQEESNKRWNIALQSALERVLKEFAGVSNAAVFLSTTSPRRGFSRQEAPASASVKLSMRNGEPVPRSLALAAARLVSGAVRGLSMQSVEVLDGNGAVALEWEAESGGSSSLERLRREHEQRIAAKIRGQVSADPGVRVSVRVELDPTARESNARTPLEGVEVSRSERTRETSRGSRPAQPGVQPNVGASVASGPGEERTIEKETEERLEPGLRQESERTAPGELKEVFAAINIPHSLLVAIWKRTNPDGEPTEAQVDQVFRAQSDKIVNQVKQLVKPQEPNQVAVDWYYDVEGPVPATQVASAMSFEMLQTYGPASALGALALLALGLTLRMGRSSGSGEALAREIGLPAEAIAAARRKEAETADRPAGEPLTVATVEDELSALSVGLDQAPEGLMEARELGPEEIEVRNMVQQVTRIADEDTDAMAELVARMMDQPR